MFAALFWGFGFVLTAVNTCRVGVILWPIDWGMAFSASSAMACMTLMFLKWAADAYGNAQAARR